MSGDQQRGEDGRYSFTVAVEERVDDDLVILHTGEATAPVVLLTDDFVAMMVSLSVRPWTTDQRNPVRE